MDNIVFFGKKENKIKEKNKSKNKIKMLVMDVDGTLTDGKIYMSNTGEAMKAFSIKDGYALANYQKYGLERTAIITGRESEIVKNRAKELKIGDLYQNIHDKAPVLKELALKYGYDLSEVAYIGDDLNDLECLEICGLSACPDDACEEIIDIVDYICEKAASEGGAVREFMEHIKEINMEG